MSLTKLAFLAILLVPVMPTHEDPVSSNLDTSFKELADPDYQLYSKSFDRARNFYAPWMSNKQTENEKLAIWYGSGENLLVALYATAMCNQESSLKIRKYNPEVKQSTDLMGAHYNLLFAELKREGRFDGQFLNKYHRINVKDPAVSKWLHLLVLYPEYGTILAIRWYSMLVDRYGLDKATRVWNQGADCLYLDHHDLNDIPEKSDYFKVRYNKSIIYLNCIHSTLANIAPDLYNTELAYSK